MKKTFKTLSLFVLGTCFTSFVSAQNNAAPAAQINENKLAPSMDKKQYEKPSKQVATPPVVTPANDLRPAPVTEVKEDTKPADPVPSGITQPIDTRNDPNAMVPKTEYKEPAPAKQVLPRPGVLNNDTPKKPASGQMPQQQVTSDH